MGFESILRRRLGPLEALVPRPRGRPPASDLWFRRALALEMTVAMDAPGRVRAGCIEAPKSRTLDLPVEAAGELVGLTQWRAARDLSVPPTKLNRWVDYDLLYWAESDPGVDLPDSRLPDGYLGKVARRRTVWPTPAIETALAVAPMPFMPRERDLDGAEMVGFRFATLDRGHEILGVNLLGGRRAGRSLRQLLPKLDGRYSFRSILDEADDEAVPRLLEALGVLEVVDDAGLAGRRGFETNKTQVTWLGHAAVLVQAEGRSILVDPLFHAASGPDDPRPDPRALPAIDGVLITHGDNDHLSPNALAQLDPQTPIYYPEAASPLAAHQVDMESMLRVLGFSELHPIHPWEKFSLGPFSIHVLPFDGEDWGLEQAQATYLVEAPGFSTFFAADSRGPEETYRHLAEHSVDLAFMGVSGAAEPLVGPPGLGYGNFYAPWIPTALRNKFVFHTAEPQESANFVQIFGPRYAFGYAAGGAPWIRTEYADKGSHGEFAARLIGSPTVPVAMPLGVPVAPGELKNLPPGTS